jgi:hypothetical protein
MQCPQCQFSNPDDHKYCGLCGRELVAQTVPDMKAELRTEIQTTFNALVKDRDVVEVKVAAAAASKLVEWAKLFAYVVGIPSTVLLALLSGVGIKNYSDVWQLSKQAEQSEEKIKTSIATATKQIDASISIATRLVEDTKAKSEPLLAQLEQLRKRVDQNTEEVSILKSKLKGIEFEQSASLSGELKSKLESALGEYQQYLAKIGFTPANEGTKVRIKINRDDVSDAYFSFADNQLVVSPNLASEPEYILAEYNWNVLNQTNPQASQGLLNGTQGAGFEHGLKYYLLCSYQNQPLVGRNYYKLIGEEELAKTSPYLFNLDQEKKFTKDDPDSLEPHHLGEIWGSAFFDVRKLLTPERADRLLLETWKRLKVPPGKPVDAAFLIDAVVETNKSLTGNADERLIREAFEKRDLK